MTVRSAEPPQLKHLEMFRSIAEERLTRLNLGWVQLEQSLVGDGAMTELLRELHTLKGEASLMGFSQIVAVVHGLEELLRPQAEGAAADAVTGDLVLRGLDLVSMAVDSATDAPADGTAAVLAAIYQLRKMNPPGAPVAPEAAPAPKKGPPGPGAEGLPAPSRGDSVRVTAAKLDRVRDSIGELMLTQARLALSASEFRKARETTREYAEQQAATPGPALRAFTMLLDAITGLESRLRDDSHRVADLISELDSGIRELRMVPIRTLFDQYPVAMRELARDIGREVRLEFEGEAVEVDRSVLDRLAEPLLHLLRNAVDHGIEPAAVRHKAGKRPEGTARIQAKLNGRLLEISVRDDGAGIDVAAVRARALELGIITEAQTRTLTEAQVLRTLFQARMSTRRQVTQVSGRGLGLNVVLSSVEGLGGTVTVHSAIGEGTTFHLAVPVAMAMTSVVMFEVGTARYALAATGVITLIDAAAHPIVASIAGPSIRYSGMLVPLVRLDVLLGESDGSAVHLEHDEAERLMIVRGPRELLALRGTRRHSEREVVLKSMGKFFARNRLISSVIPLADGTLALVLSLAELHSGHRTGPAAVVPAAKARRQTVLVVDDSPIVRDLVAEALRAHGLQIIEAGDGEDALQKMEVGPPVDLVVTDIDMPKLDGIGLLRKLRQRDGPRRLPVVVVSMRGSSEDQRRALDAGADAYLVKTDLSHAGLWTMLVRFLK